MKSTIDLVSFLCFVSLSLIGCVDKMASEDLDKCQDNLSTCLKDKKTEHDDFTEMMQTCQYNLKSKESDYDNCALTLSDSITNFNDCSQDLIAFENSGCKQLAKPSSPTIYTGCLPENDLGGEWGIFQDSRRYGKSTVFIEVHNLLPNCNMEIIYKLEAFDLMKSYTPYAGVYSYLSYPPLQTYDFSEYSGISITISAETTAGNQPQIKLQLGDIYTKGNAWHEVLISSVPGEFTQYTFNFTDFLQPEWYLAAHKALNTEGIFKIAVVLLNPNTEQIEGSIYLKNIQLF